MNTAIAECFDLLSVDHQLVAGFEPDTASTLHAENSGTPELSMETKGSRAEAILVEAIKRGEEHAFMELVERFHSPMVRVAMTFVHCEAVAEEVVQDTWMAVLEGIHRFEGRSSLKTWVFRILMNRAKTQGVRESRYVEFPGQLHETEQGGAAAAEESFVLGGEGWTGSCLNMASSQLNDSPERNIIKKELAQRIAAAIQVLPAMQRKVIVLRDVEGFESEEVCRMLGLSDTNQRVLLHRARTKVRQALQPYMEQPDPEPCDLWSLTQCA